MRELTALEGIILRKLRAGPLHSRTFHLAKGVVRNLVQRGLVRRVAGDTSPLKTYVEITGSGLVAIGARRPNMGARTIARVTPFAAPSPSNDGE